MSEVINYTLISSVDDNVALSVVDILGRNVMTKTIQVLEGENKLDLNVSDFSSGVYLLRAVSERDQFRTQKDFLVK